MGALFPLLRYALLGCLLFAATLFLGSKASAIVWQVVEFNEDARADLIELVRNKYSDEILAAQQAYPAHEVQVLIGRTRPQREKDRDGPKEVRYFYAILAGNPKFCNDLGCRLVSFVWRPDLGWYHGDNSYTNASYTNGYIVKTDMVYTLTETRLGCWSFGKVRRRPKQPTNKPCIDWSKITPKRDAVKLRWALEKSLKEKGLRTTKFSVEERAVRFKFRNLRNAAAIERVIASFESDYDFAWERKGHSYVVVVEALPPGLMYHEVLESPVKWVTE
jgi:hypothetical protein